MSTPLQGGVPKLEVESFRSHRGVQCEKGGTMRSCDSFHLLYQGSAELSASGSRRNVTGSQRGLIIDDRGTSSVSLCSAAL
jgi:hypothetical protein